MFFIAVEFDGGIVVAHLKPLQHFRFNTFCFKSSLVPLWYGISLSLVDMFLASLKYILYVGNIMLK